MERAGSEAALQMRRPHANAFNAEKRAIFFASLTETSNVTVSAELAGVSLETVYGWRRRYPEFAQRWEQAKADAVADLEMRALAQGRFGRKVEVTLRKVDDTKSSRVSRHDEASLTLQRLGRYGLGKGPLGVAASEDADREEARASEHRARVEAAIGLLAEGIKAILHNGRA
jgi:transposase-like protein